MIHTLKVYCADGFDPYRNLATEEYLLESLEPDCCVLYLWQNQNTVVIGRNQNPWKECRTNLLEKDGGQLARRLSGGGAVFHDFGNLNFTFLVSEMDYDLDRQLRVIEEACHSLGIETERSGRNDILCQGRKFSGNAFYKHRGHAYHHGTLMVSADMGKLGRYLSPSKAKLTAKGVDSVRSRVMNLNEVCPNLTITHLREALRAAFGAVYGLPVESLLSSELDKAEILRLEEHYRSWDWLYGRKFPFQFSCEGRFAWGGIQLEVQVSEGLIQNCRVFSDSMDWQIAPVLEQTLIGCPFRAGILQQKISSACPNVGADLCQLLEQLNL